MHIDWMKNRHILKLRIFVNRYVESAFDLIIINSLYLVLPRLFQFKYCHNSFIDFGYNQFGMLIILNITSKYSFFRYF
jgi:hypothetical protein